MTVESTLVQIVKAIVIFAFILQVVPLILLLERKLLGRFQSRYGPNRVGLRGLGQPLADVLKLLSKERFTPETAVPWMMAIAPVISIATAVATLAIIPFGPQGAWGGDVGLYGIDVPIGLLYFFAFGSLAFYALVLGGWASGSKYSFLGAMRSAAQLISYEVAIGLSLLGVAMMAGSLSFVDIVEAQGADGKGIWFIVPQFVGFLVFMVAGFAETARAAVRPARGRRRDRRRLQHRVRRHALRLVLHGRVHRGDRHLRRRDRLLLRRLARPRPDRARAALGAAEDVRLRRPLHLGSGYAAAPALRPADVVRLEGAAAAGHLERPRHRDRPGGLTHMSYELNEDVIEVQRGPEPGGLGGAYRTFGATLRGLRTTLGRLAEKPVTIEYPEEKTPVYPRFRGRHKLHKFEDTGLEKCVGCSLCVAACPAACIRVVADENTPEHQVSAGERYAAVYEINMSRCIFCGYCEVACPFDAITMGNDYELADYQRSDLIFTKEMLLAEPIERTPLRREGE